MTAFGPQERSAPTAAPKGEGPRTSRRAARPLRILALALVLIAAAGISARFAARTNAGRAGIVSLLDGLDLGSMGRLRLAGLEGDPFSAFSLKRVGLQDPKGVWLEADGIQAEWRPLQLLSRTVSVARLRADRITVRRRPDLVLRPPGPPSRPLLSLQIHALEADLRTDPAFSVQRGDWWVRASGRLDRSGAVAADLSASSRLHPGDGAALHADMDPKGRLSLNASAVENGGGPLAGALGLPLNAPLKGLLIGRGDVSAAMAPGRVSATGSAFAQITSGSAKVLTGRARWSSGTVLVDGEVDLSRSTLTQDAANRLGGLAEFHLKSQTTGRGPAEVSLQVSSPRTRLKAEGPLDWARRRTTGLALQLDVADLSLWLPQPKVGAASLKGSIAGASDRFQIQGHLVGRNLIEPGFGASSVSGPLRVAFLESQWRIGGRLSAEGGVGSGLTASLLGAAPSADFDLSILKNGRLVIRALDLKGRGARLIATGGQPFGGGLTFKGRLVLNDLALARPGASGAAQVDFAADQPAGSPAWRIAATAVGARLQTGVKDLDPVLGPSPEVKAEASWSPSTGLDLKSGSLRARAGDVEAQGRVDHDRRADLQLAWALKGPLTFGPLEVDGAVKGSGRVNGPLETPALDLEAETPRLAVGRLLVSPARLTLALKSVPGGLSGQAAFGGPTTNAGRASLSANFHTAGDALSLDRFQADGGGVSLRGAVAFARGALQAADIEMSAQAGAFLEGGSMQGTLQLKGPAGGETASLSLTGSDLRLAGAPPLQVLKLKGSGPLAAFPFTVEAASAAPTPANFLGRGVFSRAGRSIELNLEGAGHIRKAAYHLLQPARARLAPDERTLTARLAIGGGEADIDLLLAAGKVELTGALKSVSIAAFNPDFLGAISGSAHLKGQGGVMTGVLSSTLENARSRDAPVREALKAEIGGRLEGGRLHLESTAVNAEGLKSQGAVDIPMRTSASPFILATEADKPLRGSFSADGEIRPLWDLVAGGERTLTGKVVTSGTISGTLARPSVAGEAAVTGGRFSDGGTGLSLQNLQVESGFDGDGLTVRRFSAVDARSGSISGEGRVSFSDNGASTFTLAVKRFQLLDNDLGRAVASGSIVVTHPARGQGKLSGALTIDRADIVAAAPTPTGVVPLEVEEIHQAPQAGAVKATTTAIGPPILLDVAIHAPRGIYVKGKGLNVELSLDARVSGSLTHPDLGGSAKVVAGSYDFAGKRFDVGTAGSIKLGSSPQQIRLDLTATWEDPTLNAVVRVTGTAAKPEIALTSIPVLPQDEVLARVLFGVSASQLSGAQAAELGSALASLAGGGGFDVIGNLRQFAGLDRLALGSTQNATTTVSGGKYINKDIYLELTGGARNGTGASVEWRIRKNLSLVSRYGAALDPRYPNDTDASLSVRFRRDF